MAISECKKAKDNEALEINTKKQHSVIPTVNMDTIYWPCFENENSI